MASKGLILAGGAAAVFAAFMLSRKAKANEPPANEGGAPGADGPLPGQPNLPGVDSSLLETFEHIINNSEMYNTDDLLAVHDELLQSGYGEQAAELLVSVIEGRLAAESWIDEHGQDPQSDDIFSPEDFPTEDEYTGWDRGLGV